MPACLPRTTYPLPAPVPCALQATSSPTTCAAAPQLHTVCHTLATSPSQHPWRPSHSPLRRVSRCRHRLLPPPPLCRCRWRAAPSLHFISPPLHHCCTTPLRCRPAVGRAGRGVKLRQAQPAAARGRPVCLHQAPHLAALGAALRLLHRCAVQCGVAPRHASLRLAGWWVLLVSQRAFYLPPAASPPIPHACLQPSLQAMERVWAKAGRSLASFWTTTAVGAANLAGSPRRLTSLRMRPGTCAILGVTFRWGGGVRMRPNAVKGERMGSGGCWNSHFSTASQPPVPSGLLPPPPPPPPACAGHPECAGLGQGALDAAGGLPVHVSERLPRLGTVGCCS